MILKGGKAMAYYVGVVHFRDGHTEETGWCNQERDAERYAQIRFDQAMKTAINEHFEPTRIEVKKVSD